MEVKAIFGKFPSNKSNFVFSNSVIRIKLKLKNPLTVNKIFFLGGREMTCQALLTFKAANLSEITCCQDASLIV